MKKKMTFSDEYEGPRWTYGLQYRPFGIGTLPEGFLIGSLKEDGTPFPYGTIQYPFELSEKQVSSFQLSFVKAEGLITTPVDRPHERQAPPPFKSVRVKKDGEWHIATRTRNKYGSSRPAFPFVCLDEEVEDMMMTVCCHHGCSYAPGFTQPQFNVTLDEFIDAGGWIECDVCGTAVQVINWKDRS